MQMNQIMQIDKRQSRLAEKKRTKEKMVPVKNKKQKN